MTKEVKMIASGLVQGVNFRYYTSKKAEELGLVGYVRNTADNKVEILAQGEQENLEKLIKWCQTGPESAHVKDINIEWQKPGEIFKEFEIRF